jgi:hypothetical protein
VYEGGVGGWDRLTYLSLKPRICLLVCVLLLHKAGPVHPPPLRGGGKKGLAVVGGCKMGQVTTECRADRITVTDLKPSGRLTR